MELRERYPSGTGALHVGLTYTVYASPNIRRMYGIWRIYRIWRMRMCPRDRQKWLQVVGGQNRRLLADRYVMS